MERIADPASTLPHMLPSDQQFAAAADALGISNDDALVVYDNTGGRCQGSRGVAAPWRSCCLPFTAWRDGPVP